VYTMALHPYGNVWDRMRLALGHLRTGISISEGALSPLKRSGHENIRVSTQEALGRSTLEKAKNLL
jgi:hypothetical protein